MYDLYLTRSLNARDIKSTDFGSQAADLLFMSLECSVRLRVMNDSFGDFAVFKSRVDELQQILGEKGDLILFRSNKRGETAKAFNALAEALSWLTLCPGGVNFLGWNWTSLKEGEEKSDEPPVTLDMTLKMSLRRRQLLDAFSKVGK